MPIFFFPFPPFKKTPKYTVADKKICKLFLSYCVSTFSAERWMIK